MTVLDIVLIIIGIFIIVISYAVTEKVSEEKNKMESVREVWSDKEEGTIKDRVENIVSDRSEMIINDTEDRLCHLSNDKIMEFKEYSDQVTAKIEDNHKQAVFLYNMLNEKQKEMKEWINQLDQKHVEIEDYINKKQESFQKSVNDTALEQKKSKVKPLTNASDRQKNNAIKQSNVNISKTSTSKINTQKTNTIANSPISITATNDIIPDTPATTRNDKILNLWKEGKSILEISKQLGIGQGEVKLVVDLFKGA